MIRNLRITGNGYMLTHPVDDPNSLGVNTMTIHPSPLNMPGATPPDYGPPMPVPDGRLIVRTIHGITHEYPYADMPRAWRSHDRYLSIPTATGRIHWPWGQLLNFETIGNSAKYVRERTERSAWENQYKAAKAQAEADDVRPA